MKIENVYIYLIIYLVLKNMSISENSTKKRDLDSTEESSNESTKLCIKVSKTDNDNDSLYDKKNEIIQNVN